MDGSCGRHHSSYFPSCRPLVLTDRTCSRIGPASQSCWSWEASCGTLRGGPQIPRCVSSLRRRAAVCRSAFTWVGDPAWLSRSQLPSLHQANWRSVLRTSGRSVMCQDLSWAGLFAGGA